ncbi:MAG: multidrug DMT transporter permease [Legionella sp.]|nr:multidrug DMT transporter permease [Legionella sp.]
MAIERFFDNQNVILTFDADAFLFDKLELITKQGFSLVEINTSEKTLLERVIQDFPTLRIGAGNVINIQQLEHCYAAGVHFVSSPGFLPALAQTAAVYGINYLPGVATLSEAMHVLSLGYHQVRPYPASLAFCTLLDKCIPTLRLFPADVELDKKEAYLHLSSVAAVTVDNPTATTLQTLSMSSAFA